MRRQLPGTALLVAGLFALAPPPAEAVILPIHIDGYFGEWSPAAQAATDPAGDAGSSGIDFTTLSLANDENFLYIRFDTTVEVQPDENQDLVLIIDTDKNAGTGEALASLGGELVWRLGQRTGTFYSGGANGIGHADIGLAVGPTVSSTEFEIAIDRQAVPQGISPLFPAGDFHLALLDENSGDALVLDGGGYTFDPGTQPVASISLDRDVATHVRVASYNIQSDGLFSSGSRKSALTRMFQAVDPDIWVINEVWNHDAAEAATEIEGMLPSGPGETWHSVKRDDGNVIASRFPILNSWEVFPGNRLTAALVDLRPTHDSDLLVVANHWNCCTADSRRQEQADALIEFLHDARNAGGILDLAADTPIVFAGDFNLVGLRAQLETAITGDIADNGTFGPDSPPDWDGSDMEEANPRHPDLRMGYTWRNDSSSFYPGKLDWIFYSGSVFDLKKAYIVETRTMTPASLTAAALQAGDTDLASDHAPVVADFDFPATTTGVGDAGPTLTPRLWASPNPLRRSTAVQFRLLEASPVDLRVYDSRGGLVRVLAADLTLSAGDHRYEWDGRGAHGRNVAAGVYYLALHTASGQSRHRVTLLR